MTIIHAHPLIFSASGRNLSKLRPFNQIVDGKTDVNPVFWHGNGYPQVSFILFAVFTAEYRISLISIPLE